ncbi:Domain of uncharacterised function, DUF446 [[Haemophilus] ducreyi]|nr:Uncharacterized conserved protein YqcC, DUF446 family [[Haemophilus] ducreyi]VEG83822.1 Domain of uncharacterised function, DUF446 [[Haemophilus] ducreyi]
MLKFQQLFLSSFTTMKTKVRQHLNDLELALRLHKQWQVTAPSLDQLANDQPFCLGSLTATEWLQWVFIPRMHALLDADADLPRNFSITPYLEEALKQETYLPAIQQPILLLELLLKD